ncbi:pentapeptide repeat-containing protein [Microbacterium sp. Mu-80]|uniref:Pentapeptide repeat-containing protein n=1 Tax=Microbacterium bandirmense TaxID=3122050 RepID=A0ABU8L941_9MICO
MARTSDSLITPRVSPPDLPDTLGTGTPSRATDLLAAEVALRGDVDLAHSSLEQCRLVADAESVDLTGSTLMDVEIVAPRVAALTMRDATVRRLRIAGGRIGTLDLSSARISELELADVRIDYLTFGAARTEDALIIGCTLRSLDVPHAELTRVRVEGSRAGEVDPRGMRATHVDLRGLDAEAFLDVNSLRGVTMSPFQVQLLAPVMAAGLGIRLRD